MYSCGDLKIAKNVLITFLKGLGAGTYTTFDILKVYQGQVTRNQGIPAQCSWNANFGKILKQCEKDTSGNVICEVKKNKKIKINGGYTNTSVWIIK